MLAYASSFTEILCRVDESAALLQFKESFVIINQSKSHDPSAYPKVSSWTLEGDNRDCCLWDGVECDEDTDHVIGLDLSSGRLYGSLAPNSSLFRLVHLQSLNLAYNHFNYSQIPSQVSNLSRLAYLNLSASMFSGQIPSQISQLSHLTSLDLSDNYDLYSGKQLLKLESGLISLFGNLTRLQRLHLNYVNISSVVPRILASLSSLTSIHLQYCGLQGNIPVGIFKLPNLKVLDVAYNEGLTGYLSEFTWTSPLEVLNLAYTSFLGEIPTSIGNLGSLNKLDLRSCNFSGFIPSSLGNLTSLIYLEISNNSFVGKIPSSIGNLIQLSVLDLFINQLIGRIPFELGNLTQLSYLSLGYNLLEGEIPFPLMNLTKLTSLELGNNNLQGRIPDSIFNLKNLKYLDLASNTFSGSVEFGKFVKLKYLTFLRLSNNQLYVEDASANASLPKFQLLGLSSCNLNKFPDFVKNQDRLVCLDLSNNNIHGMLPEWIWDTSKLSLVSLCLSKNFITSLGQYPMPLPWTRLRGLDLRSNLLQGSLPIPPATIAHYYISNNSLTGNISELICILTSIRVLDLAKNNLSGSLPRCMQNFGASLLVIDLERNKFRGSIPQTWIQGTELRIINFRQNRFQGQLPRSLVKCMRLEVADFSNNKLHDLFPSWLENLPNLKVLNLRSNNFHGQIGASKAGYKFPNLRVIDLSLNGFSGKLPFEIFGNWKQPREFANSDILSYIQVNSSIVPQRFLCNSWLYDYNYTMTMTNKGVAVFYEKVLELFKAIDISSNRFGGEIPESIENLRGFRLLNLSNNVLTGHIPPSLANLTELESLDLSKNNFSGEIPQQLTQLTFLEFFNVSNNLLTGPIPQGDQFGTFGNNSFEGNSGLCGRPLSKNCEDSNAYLPAPPSISVDQSQESGSAFEFGWEILVVVVVGYAFGQVVGVTIGHIVITRKHDWFMNIFGKNSFLITSILFCGCVVLSVIVFWLYLK
ncbi:receptor-like protein 6 [Carya illinoinensis]|nr:receptor-like protein 6 [Carya illinoinensis]